MEKVKIYLNKEDSKLYENSNSVLSCFLCAMFLYSKTCKLVDLQQFRIKDVKVIKDAPHLYSLLLKLERREINAEK